MPAPRVAVAASGGCDSSALLHCTARQARLLGIDVVALHVHHGLMPQADDWLAHVRTQSRRWGAEFHSQRLQGAPAGGESVEAWARRERYRALAQMAATERCDLVLLAHHRRDQAETWLLQALRGAGAAGLSAMPRSALRDGVVWFRPWLDQPRSAIEAYVHRHRLRWVDDTSNANPRFARSRLRSAVWPLLQAAFPDAELSLSQAAQHAQDAAAVIEEVVAQALPRLQHEGALNVKAWLELPPHHRRLTLRAWLAAALAAPVSETLVRRLSIELPMASTARWQAGAQEVQLYRGALRVLPTPAAPLVVASSAVDIDLSRPGRHLLPAWRGHVLVEPVLQGGVSAEVLATLQVRSRTGGEQFRLTARGTVRSLKKQYQSREVPARQRGGPLLFTALGELVFAPGLGLDARHVAGPGVPQCALQWVPDVSLLVPRPEKLAD